MKLASWSGLPILTESVAVPKRKPGSYRRQLNILMRPMQPFAGTERAHVFFQCPNTNSS